MDEPTSSLDEREVAVLFDVIRQLRREGVAVIFITHRLDELYQVCDRVTVMRDGRTVMTAPHGRRRQAAVGRRDARARSRSGAGARRTGFDAARRGGGRARCCAAEGLAIGKKRARRARRGAGRQIVGLAGLLGSGRTEVARAIFGADPADAGVSA